jgi:hypothetical protein
MNTTQRHLLATELDRVERYGWTVLESAVVPAARNLLGARRDVAVVMCDSGDDHHGRYRLSLTAADMFAGSHSRFDTLGAALDHYRTHTGHYATTQQALF